MALVRCVGEDQYLVAVGSNLFTMRGDGGLEKLAVCGEVPEGAAGKECEGPAFISDLATCDGGVVVSSNNKLLELISWQGERTASTVAVKRPTAVRVCPNDGRVVVSDKAGDVYSYSAGLADRRYLLGHVSVVMDCLVTGDGRFLLTSDRDEKIRVSHYPNCYSVHSYLLSHTEFVHGIDLLSDSTLASIGGDCTLKLWDLSSGQCTCSHTFPVPFTSLSVVSSTPSSPLLLTSTADTLSLRSPSDLSTPLSSVSPGSRVVGVAGCGSSVVVLTETAVVRYPLSEGGILGSGQVVESTVVDFTGLVVGGLPERKKPAGTKGFQAYFERKKRRIEEENAKAEAKAVTLGAS